MSHKASLFHQMLQILESKKSFGISKHSIKTEAMRDKEGWDKVEAYHHAIENKIFSFKSFESYLDTAKAFAKWCKEQGVGKDLQKAKALTSEFVKERIEKGYSAWTIKKDVAALRKIFDRDVCRDIKLPQRSTYEIKRSRNDKHNKVIYERHRDIVDFCRGTGLREKELLRVRVSDVYEKDRRLFVHVECGKGGRKREVPILREYEKRVREIVKIAKKRGEDRLFKNVDERIDVHGLRREYARARYKELERELGREGRELSREESYITKDGHIYDKVILRELSKNLGHNREDVVVKHYLDR